MSLAACAGQVHAGSVADVVRLGHAGSLRRNVQRLVPAPGVDVGPPEHVQGSAAGTTYAGSPQPPHGVLQQADRQVGFVQEPCGGTDSPQSGLVEGRAADLAQVPDELASAAERVDARLYPEPVRAGIGARAMASVRESLIFQEAKNAAYGLAAFERA